MVWQLYIKIRTEIEIHLDYVSLQVFWIYPIYCISFVLNTVMYQEAQESVFCNDHSQALAGFPCTIPKTPFRTDAEAAGTSLFCDVYSIHLHTASTLLHRVISILCHILRHARIRCVCVCADCGQCASIYAARSSPWHSSLRTDISHVL